MFLPINFVLGERISYDYKVINCSMCADLYALLCNERVCFLTKTMPSSNRCVHESTLMCYCGMDTFNRVHLNVLICGRCVYTCLFKCGIMEWWNECMYLCGLICAVMW